MRCSPLRVGVYGIAIQGNKILMVPTQSGTLEIVNFPGGGVDQGESFAQALVRECQEEIACAITMGNYHGYQVYQHPDFPESTMFNIYYTITLEGESNNGIWVPFSEIDTYRLLPPDREIMKQLMNNI